VPIFQCQNLLLIIKQFAATGVT